MVYSPYPKRPERLGICRYNYKGSTFSAFSYFKTLSFGPVWGIESACVFKFGLAGICLN